MTSTGFQYMFWTQSIETIYYYHIHILLHMLWFKVSISTVKAFALFIMNIITMWASSSEKILAIPVLCDLGLTSRCFQLTSWIRNFTSMNSDSETHVLWKILGYRFRPPWYDVKLLCCRRRLPKNFVSWSRQSFLFQWSCFGNASKAYGFSILLQ